MKKYFILILSIVYFVVLSTYCFVRYYNPDNEAGIIYFFVKSLSQPDSLALGQSTIYLPKYNTFAYDSGKNEFGLYHNILYKGKYFVGFQNKTDYDLNDHLDLFKRLIEYKHSVIDAGYFYVFRANFENIFIYHKLLSYDESGELWFFSSIVIPERNLYIDIAGPSYDVFTAMDIIKFCVYGDQSMEMLFVSDLSTEFKL